MAWDPEQAPDPARWTALDEAARIAEIESWHRDNPQPALHAPQLNLRMHAAMHGVVEAQIAAADPPATAATIERLMADGLRRHPAVHLVMRVLTEHLHQTMVAGIPFDAARYAAALEGLRAEDGIVVEGLRWMDDAPEEPPQNRAERRRRKR